jgi:Tol biopolymer transport system component
VTERVSVDSSGTEGDSPSNAPTLSADGLLVAFDSIASNLVSGDANRRRDCFVRDRVGATTQRVSVTSSGGEADDDSRAAVISADGTTVAFVSLARNLASNDTLHADVFVRDLAGGITELVSVDSSGTAGNDHSGYYYNGYFEYYYPPRLSSDGRIVAFRSLASNLVAGDTNSCCDVFVHDRATGITERVSVDSAGVEIATGGDLPSISADGNLVAFQSGDIFVHDRTTGITERVSVDSSGAKANNLSQMASISGDGRFVAFESYASNLVAGDTNGKLDVFVHDRSTGITERVSVATSGAQADSNCLAPSIASDGNLVAFSSRSSTLVSGDQNGWGDIFVHDRTTGITERVSVDSAGGEADGESSVPSISADGHTVAFESWAMNLVPGDTNSVDDAFVHDRCITPASWSNYDAGFPGTLGIPSFTARSNPLLGSHLTLDVTNSRGSATLGFLLVGFQRASLHTNRGGDLLLLPDVVKAIALPATGASFDGDIPQQDSNCGVALDLQVVEYDPGAAQAVSFTPGLELILGR